MTFTRSLLAVAALSLPAPAAIACAAHAEASHAAITLAASHGDDHEMARGASAVEAGALTITGAFSRATLPNAPVGGGYMTISNSGDTDDRLLSVSSTVSGRAELHEMQMEGDVMRMRALDDGLPIPAGETVELRPGGYHIMFTDLLAPLVAGEIAQVTLTFEQAGEVSVPLAIADTDATGVMEHGGTH